MNIVNDSKFSEWLDTIHAKELKQLPKFETHKYQIEHVIYCKSYYSF